MVLTRIIISKRYPQWFLMVALVFGGISLLMSFQIQQQEQVGHQANGKTKDSHHSVHAVLRTSHESQQQILNRPLQSSTVTTSGNQYQLKGASPINSSSSVSSSSTTSPPYHVVFSTSCEEQMFWESYVFFFHAWKVGQPGTVTRLASGCSDEQAKQLQDFHDRHIAPWNPKNFFLHLTPDFSRDAEYIRTGNARYKYMNKPYGLRHWLETTFGLNKNTTTATATADNDRSVEDGIVILMDPDMILLRPIVHDYTHQDVIFIETNPATKVVKHGFPMAQQDGYLNNQWMYLNASYITDGGNIRHIPQTDGPKHYNTGPPYLATVKDMYNIAKLWTEYAPRVYEIHPKLFAEMFGYIYATTQLHLPHTLIKSLVVSTTETAQREGWNYIQNWPDSDVCLPLPTTISSTDVKPFQGTTDSNVAKSTITTTTTTMTTPPLPVALHYCKRYMLHTWFFSKYRLKKNYISCESPLLQMPPLDLVARNYRYSLQPPPHGYYHNSKAGPWIPPVANWTDPLRSKKEAFMICQMIRAVNEAAEYFKRTACNSTETTRTNWNRNYTFFNDPDH